MADISKIKLKGITYAIKDETARTDLSNKVPKTFTNGTTTTTHDGRNIIITDTSAETTASIASNSIKVSDSSNTHSIGIVENIIENAVTPGLLIQMQNSPAVTLYATPNTSSEALLTIGGARLTGITNPINNSDAANKAYVDNFTRIYAQPDEPTNPKEGDVWIDTDEAVVSYAEGVNF